MIHCLANQNDHFVTTDMFKLILQNDELIFFYDYLNGAFVLKFPIKETFFLIDVSNGPL
jgi:hypothetical protein